MHYANGLFIKINTCITAVLSFGLISTAIAGMVDIAAEQPLVSVGEVSFSNGLMNVNGQTIIRDGHTVVETEDNSKAQRIKQGDYVAVTGDIVESGRILATTILVLDEEYIEGSSPAYIRAEIDKISDSGFAYSSDSSIDFTQTLYDSDMLYASNGDVAEFSGIMVGDVFVASDAAVLDQASANTSGRIGANVAGQRASGVRGQRASGLRGQRASGLRGQRASGLRGQRASGVRGQRASGLRGQRASGVRGQRASGLRGQRASGVRGQRASGLRGQRASGVRGQRASGLRGQRASGSR